MRRPNRGFRAEALDLEGRRLMAVAPAATAAKAPPVQFVSSLSAMFIGSFQVVSEQAGSALLTLSRSNTVGPLQAEVKITDGPGGNPIVPAFDQVVTFANGQSLATVVVPITPSAPNSGVVQVPLTVQPVGPAPTNLAGWESSFTLLVLPSDPTAPPQVVAEEVTSQGLLLGFNKPMDPASVADLNNYSVSLVNHKYHGGTFSSLFGTGRITTSEVPVRFRAAEYDPATQSVLLVPLKHKYDLSGLTDETTPRWLATWAKANHPAQAGPGLTDLQGTPINAAPTPGVVALRLSNFLYGIGL